MITGVNFKILPPSPTPQATGGGDDFWTSSGKNEKLDI